MDIGTVEDLAHELAQEVGVRLGMDPMDDGRPPSGPGEDESALLAALLGEILGAANVLALATAAAAAGAVCPDPHVHEEDVKMNAPPCAKCQSKDHGAPDCPHDDDPEEPIQ